MNRLTACLTGFWLSFFFSFSVYGQDPGKILIKFDNDPSKPSTETTRICSQDTNSFTIINETPATCVNANVKYCWKLSFNGMNEEDLNVSPDAQSSYKPKPGDFKNGPGTYVFKRYYYCPPNTCSNAVSQQSSFVTIILKGDASQSDFKIKQNSIPCQDFNGQIELEVSNIEKYKNLEVELRIGNQSKDSKILNEQSKYIFENITQGSLEVKLLENDNICHDYPLATLEISNLQIPVLASKKDTICYRNSFNLSVSKIQKNIHYSLLKLKENPNEKDTIEIKISNSENPIMFNVKEKGKYIVEALDTLSKCRTLSQDTFSLEVVRPNVTAGFKVINSKPLCGLDKLYLELTDIDSTLEYTLISGNNVIETITDTTRFKPIDLPDEDKVIQYKVEVKTKSSPGCTDTLPVTLEVKVNKLPAIFKVSGGGEYCENLPGVFIKLSGSQNKTNYVLQSPGKPDITIPGNNMPLIFPDIKGQGIYTIKAVQTETECSSQMDGTAKVIVNSIPKIGIIQFENASNTPIQKTCQYNTTDKLQIQMISGTPPYKYTIDGGINQESETSEICVPLDTRFPGILSFNSLKIADKNDCQNIISFDKSIEVYKAPEALAKIEGIPDISKTFKLFAENVTNNNNLRFAWTFIDSVFINSTKLKNFEGDTINNVKLDTAGGQYALMVATDTVTSCSTRDYIDLSFGENCKLNYNPKICVDSLKSKHILSLGGKNIQLSDLYCPGCELSITDDNLHLSLNDIVDEKVIKFPVTFDTDSSGCTAITGLIKLEIFPTGLTKGKDYFDPKPVYNLKICRDLKDTEILKFTLPDVVPADGLILSYTINGGPILQSTLNSGTFSVQLENKKLNINTIKLLEVKNTLNASCTKILNNEYTYDVYECRTPELSLSSNITGDIVCPNQSGIMLEIKDNNENPSGFDVSKTDIQWTASVNNTIFPGVIKIVSTDSKRAILNIENSIFSFYKGQNIVIKVIVSREFTDPAFTAKKEITLIFTIGDESAPDKSVIRKYPGDLFYYVKKDPDLCLRWAYVDLTVNPNPDWEKGIQITQTSAIKLTKSGLSVLGNDAFTQKLENKTSGVFAPKAYLWVDAWEKNGSVCDFTTADCITRTYYNTTFPPPGAPRSDGKSAELRIFPNPAEGNIKLYIDNDYTGNYNIRITDLYGRMVSGEGTLRKTEKYEVFEYNAEALYNGIYLLHLSDEQGNELISKVIIQKN